MIKEISKQDYFGTLMSILTDETRRLMRSMDKEYKLEQEAWIINAEMTKAGNWIDHILVLNYSPTGLTLYKMLCKKFYHNIEN